MTANELKPLIGQKVIVNFKGLQLVGKLIGIHPQFNGRDGLVLLPGQKKMTRFWASKISKIK
jgi:hypothetical protein